MGIRARNTRLLAYGLLNSKHSLLVKRNFFAMDPLHLDLDWGPFLLENDCLTLDKSGSTFCGDVCIHDGMWWSFARLPFFAGSVVVKGFFHVDL